MSPICIQHLGPGVITIYRPTSHTSSGDGSISNPANGYDTDLVSYSSQAVATDSPTDLSNQRTTVYSGWAGGTRSGKLVVRRKTSGSTDDIEYANWIIIIDYSTDGGGVYTTLENTNNATGNMALGDVEVSLSSISAALLRLRVRTTVSGGVDEFDTPYNATATANIYDIRFEEF